VGHKIPQKNNFLKELLLQMSSTNVRTFDIQIYNNYSFYRNKDKIFSLPQDNAMSTSC
jgi:hypothetical protein